MHDWGLAHWALILVQLLVATLCGGIIGFQRETTERPAGFRTHILVCIGSAIYMLVSLAVAGDRFDPGRIAAQVASGMGFLGAGTIIKQGNIVRGLTTAASLWAVAGIGLAVGFGVQTMGIALLGTLLVFFALTGLKQIEDRREMGHHAFFLDITMTNPRPHVSSVQQILLAHSIELLSITIANEDEAEAMISVEGRSPTREALEMAIGEIMQGEGVRNIQRKIR